MIFDDVYPYLKELRNYADFIVGVYDNAKLDDKEVQKLMGDYVDALIIGRHEEYDFGSYKRGYSYLREKGVLDKVDKLILCNDSVIFQGRSLAPFFKREVKKDFYGFTAYKKGIQYNTPAKNIPPHIQSYFLSISKEIFSQDWFNDFIMSVKKESGRDDDIVGLTILDESNTGIETLKTVDWEEGVDKSAWFGQIAEQVGAWLDTNGFASVDEVVDDYNTSGDSTKIVALATVFDDVKYLAVINP